jgi:SOS response associated peptidase (SRAP)
MKTSRFTEELITYVLKRVELGVRWGVPPKNGRRRGHVLRVVEEVPWTRPFRAEATDDTGVGVGHTYTVVTGAPGKVSGDIHDRQPVILQPGSWDAWLGGTPTEAADILLGAHEAELLYYPVPKAVGSPRNNGPELVEPIEL